MNEVDVRPPSTRSAKDLVADVLEFWAHSREPDARAVLKEHPELAGDSEAVIDLAFGEFCLRLDRGEFVNPRAFAAHFPTCRSTLFRIMNGHQLTVDNPGLIADAPCKKWPEPGDTFVGFRVIRELGRGAFARVYLATEPDLGNRTVVLKVGLHGGGEAKILGRLRHDNIVPVHAMRQDLLTGRTVVCMPYLGATTLADVIEHAFARPGMPAHAAIILEAARPRPEEVESLGPLEPSPILRAGTYVEGVLAMGVQMAEALAFVHERKIYHRDLKPTNVLVRPDGRPMLLDFNLSFDEQAQQQTLGGTLIYMAPEMLRAVAQKKAGPDLLDGRSDLYSLGVILYEMLSGEHPFEEVLWGKSAEGNRQRLAELQKTALRPLRDVNPEVDKRVARIVDRCLAYDPRERFPSAAELARALRQCLSRPQRWRRRAARHPYAMLSAGLAAVVLTAVAVFVGLREPYSQRQLQEGMRALEQGQYTQAIDHLSRSLAEAESSQAYLARGRANMKAGNLDAALVDFTTADRLQPTGRSRAALAYCCSVLKHAPAVVVGYYKSALQRGFQTAVVYNNLGQALTWMPDGSDAEAAQCFQKATLADPGLQAAYYNRATLALKQAGYHLDRISDDDVREGLAAITRAIELGPATAQAHLDAAELCVLAAKIEPRWKERAFDHLASALDLGLPPSRLKIDIILRPLHGPEFTRLTERPAVNTTPVPPVRVLDPLEGS